MTLIHNPDTHCLGKKDPKPPKLKISDYLDLERALPQAPLQVDNSARQTIALAMYLNDHEGDCTCAAIGNTLRVNSRGERRLTDDDIQGAYVAVTGQEGAAFDPATGANDNGCAEVDVLNYWMTTGVGGEKVLGHAGVDMTDPAEVKAVAWLFGSVYIGVALKVAQQDQVVWDYDTSSADWGGHAVPILDVNVPFLGQEGLYVIGTWGAYKGCTPAFIQGQADEGHAIITPEWLAANQGNPLINTDALAADLQKLQAGAARAVQSKSKRRSK